MFPTKEVRQIRILITGVAGFIGSNLAETLIARGHDVAGIDDFSHGSTLNLESIREHVNFTLHRADIREVSAVERAAEGCEAIVHLAAHKIPRYSDAYDTLMVNAVGSEVLAQVAARNAQKIIAASTSDAYGKNPNVPFNEEMDCVIGPPSVKRWAYAISKMFEEQLLLACHERFGVQVVLLRFFGGYGPNQNLTWWGGPQSVFIGNALARMPLPLHGDGKQTRSFTYVSDHVDGIIAAIERSEADNTMVNIGATREITIEGLARLIWRLIHGNEDVPLLEWIPYETFGRYEDVRRRVPDISRARDLLGFEPKVELEDGLRRTIEWQIKRQERNVTQPTTFPRNE
jgi:UDP-glucose 4-epimerase